MTPFPKTLKDYINVAALRAYTKTVEAEYEMLKALHDHLGLSMGGIVPGVMECWSIIMACSSLPFLSWPSHH